MGPSPVTARIGAPAEAIPLERLPFWVVAHAGGSQYDVIAKTSSETLARACKRVYDSDHDQVAGILDTENGVFV